MLGFKGFKTRYPAFGLDRGGVLKKAFYLTIKGFGNKINNYGMERIFFLVTIGGFNT
jgi:hypothetical protein